MRWLALCLATAGAAEAQEVYLTDDGSVYSRDPIAGGAILVNADDPADEITLGQTCAASHPVLGSGTWDWDDDGLTLRFGSAVLRLDGPPPPDAPDCGG